MKKSTSLPATVDLLGNATIIQNSTHSKRKDFAGTGNPRYIRALLALIKRSVTRESLDQVAGCANSPDLVSKLRDLGLDIPCQRVPAYDRDGELIRHGVYSLTSLDRRKIHQWFAVRARGEL